jgi:thiol-disulfide isomerase/thioredoxin
VVDEATPAAGPAGAEDGEDTGRHDPPHAPRVGKWVTVLAAVVGVLALVAVLVATSGPGPVRAPAVAPLPRLGGGPPVSITAARPAVLTFFASWCSPCRAELPMIARVASREAPLARVVFVGVDGNDDPASGLSFARSSGVTFAVAQDALSAVAPRFGLQGYPDTVFIDARGNVAGMVRGPISQATLESWLSRLSS